MRVLSGAYPFLGMINAGLMTANGVEGRRRFFGQVATRLMVCDRRHRTRRFRAAASLTHLCACRTAGKRTRSTWARPPYVNAEYFLKNYLYMVHGERYALNPRLSRPHTLTFRATLPKHPLPACSLTLWRSPRLTDRVSLSKVTASFLSSVNDANQSAIALLTLIGPRLSNRRSQSGMRISSCRARACALDGTASMSVGGTRRGRRSEGL